MAQRITSIDLSSTAARIVILEASLRHASLVSVQTIVFPEDLKSEAALWAHVRQSLKYSIDSLVVALDGRMSSTRMLSFPFTDTRKIDVAVGFELEGQIPYDINDVVTTWQIVEKQQHRMLVLVGTTPKKPLMQHIISSTEADLEPRVILLPSVALAEYLPPDSHESQAILSLDATQSHVAVVRNGLRFVRTVRFGGNDIDRVLVNKYNISQAEAALLRETKGHLILEGHSESSEAIDLSNTIGLALDPLVSNLMSTFKVLALSDMPKSLALTGMLSRLPGLPQFLSRHLGISVVLLDLRERINFISFGEGNIAPEYAVALGMAVSLYRHGNEVPLNFRRGELIYHGDMQLYRNQFIRFASGLLIVFAMAFAASMFRYSLIRSEESHINQGFCDATMHIIGKEICDPTAALATLKQTSNTEGTIIPTYSAAALFEMLSRLIGSNIDVQFSELELRVDAIPGQADRLTGKGEAANFETTDQLIATLKNNDCVQDAEVSQLRKTANASRVEFNLLAKLQCPPGVKPDAQSKVVNHEQNRSMD